MPFIENCPQIAVEKGDHKIPASKTVLIQITDPGNKFVIPYYGILFEEIHRFEFYDVSEKISNMIKPITEEQAFNLVQILNRALQKDYNVVVHCTAGLCRSGAVAEVGKIMGFTPVHENRLPNVEVKSKMLRLLYDRPY